ncbi:hypothetical protein BT63DRAFT_449952 [Microthyrium microscopicum]|uniref:Anaphase-promoting complex subunit 5 n=1 Tax=Microthyrium microscopicum TaxID=703497 RepID=A0A6A6URP9_9PEZI|nr:hypothetical protein BT63DRAFT_449952 [Microthyrium microscopicum]
MSRYLTASKVGLLVLVILYTDSDVPTQAIIPILRFITSRVIPQSVSDSDGSKPISSPSLLLSVDDFERCLKPFPVTAGLPGRNLYDKYVEKLWALNNLHVLHEFFRDLKNVLVDPKSPSPPAAQAGSGRNVIQLARVSPLGVFVRRAQLEFARLQFDDTVKIWEAFVKFRAPSERTLQRRTSTATTLTFDNNLSALHISPDSALINAVYPNFQQVKSKPEDLSTEEMEKLLEFQIEKLQRLGNRLPDEVRDTCKHMLLRSAAVPSLAHFVKFFDAWRAGDYTTSFESLHRYFDYTMHTRDRSFYQYALLHMAILEADFGCFSEAVAAINETISTARENQDMNCLNFSLSWLNNLARTYPKEVKRAGVSIAVGSEREGLAYLKSKAKEMKLPNLLSSTLLNESKWILSMGDSVPQAFERVYQAGHLNVMHDFQNMFGSQLLVTGTIYGRLGFNQVSESYCDVLLDCYRYCSPVDEVLRASCRKAHSAVQLGFYKRATSILEDLQPLVRRNLRSTQYLMTYSALMRLKHALRKHDLDAAAYLLEQLSPTGSSTTIDPDLSFQVSLLKIDYLKRLGSFDAAYNTIEDLADQLKADDADIYQRIHVMVLKALLFDTIGKPQKGFSIAMRAANAAWQARIIPALWEAWGAVANILGALGEFDAERKVLEGIIPQALGCGDLALCAQLYCWQADACMGLAGVANDSQRVRGSWMTKADMYLDRAMSYYKRIEDVRGECDCMSKKSTIASARGDAGLAEDWARRYIALYDTHLKAIHDSDDEGDGE